MAFFTDMKRSLTETGKQVAQKTKELSDTVQLKAQLSREKEALNRQYASDSLRYRSGHFYHFPQKPHNLPRG